MSISFNINEDNLFRNDDDRNSSYFIPSFSCFSFPVTGLITSISCLVAVCLSITIYLQFPPLIIKNIK